MTGTLVEISAAVAGFTSLTDTDQLKRLDDLAVTYSQLPKTDAEAGLDIWFRLYERFPEEDGFGVCWAILHMIESYHPVSDRYVVASVQRKPTEFPVMMVNRILNAGTKTVGDVDLLALLQSVVDDANRPDSIRETARGFVEHQKRVAE
jgi:hypothetical protein